MLTHVKKHPDAKGFIIEGYPRTSTQLEEFEKEVSHKSLKLDENSNPPWVHEKKFSMNSYFSWFQCKMGVILDRATGPGHFDWLWGVLLHSETPEERQREGENRRQPGRHQQSHLVLYGEYTACLQILWWSRKTCCCKSKLDPSSGKLYRKKKDLKRAKLISCHFVDMFIFWNKII